MHEKNWDFCPELKFIYHGRKDNGQGLRYWHTPGVMDGGISVSIDAGKDGYIYIELCKDSFIEQLLDKIRFKPEVNKEYTAYMREQYPGRIYVSAHYERVAGRWKYDQEKEDTKESKTSFSTLVPDHMMRLVRLSNPMTGASKIFTEFVKEFSEEPSPTINYIQMSRSQA